MRRLLRVLFIGTLMVLFWIVFTIVVAAGVRIQRQMYDRISTEAKP